MLKKFLNMITTLFLLLLLGFQLWYITAKKADKTVSPAYLQTILKNRRLARIIGGGLILLATIFFIVRLGVMSGISAAVVGLMGVGSLGRLAATVSIHQRQSRLRAVCTVCNP